MKRGSNLMRWSFREFIEAYQAKISQYDRSDIFLSKIRYNAHRDTWYMAGKGNSMPTQEEKLSTFEQAQVQVDEAIKDLNHYVTMLIGNVKKHEWEIREMKGSLRSIDDRLTSLEQGVNTRLGTLDARMGALEARVGALETHIGTFEQGVNTRFEAQDKKLDQILLSLAALTPKPDREA
jgi:uncharacterized coiled-coil protein SlyX